MIASEERYKEKKKKESVPEKENLSRKGIIEMSPKITATRCLPSLSTRGHRPPGCQVDCWNIVCADGTRLG